jgi:hypothetical protein
MSPLAVYIISSLSLSLNCCAVKYIRVTESHWRFVPARYVGRGDCSCLSLRCFPYFRKVATCLEPISYRETLLSILLRAIVYFSTQIAECTCTVCKKKFVRLWRRTAATVHAEALSVVQCDDCYVLETYAAPVTIVLLSMRTKWQHELL